MIDNTGAFTKRADLRKCVTSRVMPRVFAELFRLADAANLLEQPELAVHRMGKLLALHGVEA